MKLSLLAWQWSYYADTHRDRRNLLIHLLTMPIFVAGFLAVPLGLVTHRWISSGIGLVSMVLVMVVQGMGHRLEKTAPPKIEGPADAIRRILAEQLVTFPRYLVTGGVFRAWTT